MCRTDWEVCMSSAMVVLYDILFVHTCALLSFVNYVGILWGGRDRGGGKNRPRRRLVSSAAEKPTLGVCLWWNKTPGVFTVNLPWCLPLCLPHGNRTNAKRWFWATTNHVPPLTARISENHDCRTIWRHIPGATVYSANIHLPWTVPVVYREVAWHTTRTYRGDSIPHQWSMT